MYTLHGYYYLEFLWEVSIDHEADLPLTVLIWLIFMESQSISISERRKLASDIIPLADCQLISL